MTPEQVAEIRQLEGKKTNTEIAAMFGVSRGTIRQIYKGEIWSANRTRNPKYLTAEQIEAIRTSQGRRKEVAEEYGISQTTVYRIRAGETYTHVRR